MAYLQLEKVDLNYDKDDQVRADWIFSLLIEFIGYKVYISTK